MDYSNSAFPVQISQIDDTTGQSFTSKLVGGMSRHAYITTELYAALLSNPVYLANKEMTTKVLRDIAFKEGATLDMMFAAAEQETT